MGSFFSRIRRGAHNVWATLTLMLLMLALIIQLVSVTGEVRTTQSQNRCRSLAAAELSSAELVRDDALSDLQEVIARLFDASYKRDTAAIDVEIGRLPALSERIHNATVAIHEANERRIESVDKCGG